MTVRLDLVEPGARVSYEDAANPRREGVVEAILLDGREYRILWDDGSHDLSDLRQPGWHLVADMPGSIFDGADIIAVYTRGDAIRDGTLVPATDLVPDEPDFVRQAGWLRPVALSSSLAEIVIPTDAELNRGQDVKGRLWDLLRMAAMYGKARDRGDGSWVAFPCIFVLAGREGRNGRRTFDLRVHAGPGDDGEPVVTICQPGEE